MLKMLKTALSHETFAERNVSVFARVYVSRFLSLSVCFFCASIFLWINMRRKISCIINSQFYVQLVGSFFLLLLFAATWIAIHFEFLTLPFASVLSSFYEFLSSFSSRELTFFNKNEKLFITRRSFTFFITHKAFFFYVFQQIFTWIINYLQSHRHLVAGWRFCWFPAFEMENSKTRGEHQSLVKKSERS